MRETTLMEQRERIWKRIENETREQCEALNAALERVPLMVGQEVAWTFHGHLGTTDGFSPIHVVGEPPGEEQETLCGEDIPPAARRVAVDRLWREALDPCKSCVAIQAASDVSRNGSLQKDAA